MKKVLKYLGLGILGFLGLVFGSLGIWHLLHHQSIEEASPMASNFKGQILATSDADMVSTAYVDGVLNKVKGIEDQLSLIRVEEGIPNLRSKIQVSNSVVSWPAIIEWHPKSKYAYVAETKAIYTGTELQLGDVFADFPKGQKVTVIDYSTPDQPKVVQEKSIGENIGSVSINNEGSLLASTSSEQGKMIVISRLDSGLIKETFYFSHGEEDVNGGIMTIEFHPSENIIAANYENRKVIFYEVSSQGTNVELKKIGASLEVAKKWSVGNWHPSGKFFILSDVAWGEGATGVIFNSKGALVSVRFDKAGNHSVVSTATVGLSPEGFDLSPNGQYAVTVNMRRTVFPEAFWFIPGKNASTLTLTKINAETGELTTVGGQYGFEGALPEDAVFDQESNSIAVAVYHDRNVQKPKEGWIEFWEVENDVLIRTDKRIDVTRGVHNLLLVNK